MFISRDTPQEHNRLLLMGVVYLVVMGLLVAFALAVYKKAFTPVTTVMVQAERAGLQLPEFGDVRRNGVIVGQIRSVEQDGEQAVIELALQPDAADDIPANVGVEIKPTTLFGQKYVEFVDASTSSSTGADATTVAAGGSSRAATGTSIAAAGGSLEEGTVIPSDRVRTSVELDAILAKLHPLLQAVRPQDLNSTLHALATALSGNGDELGATMADLNDYLGRMNVHLPTLHRDLQKFGEVAKTYSIAAPDLVKVLENATTTARTITDERKQLEGLLGSLTGVATNTRDLLAENEVMIEYEMKLAPPLLELLSEYSPEYPCLLKGLDKYTDSLNEIFRNNRVSQTMSFNGTQRRGYTVDDRPEWGEIGHGPTCLGLPNPQVPSPPNQLRDGSEENSPWPALEGAQ